jgi:hypothetical protein
MCVYLFISGFPQLELDLYWGKGPVYIVTQDLQFLTFWELILCHKRAWSFVQVIVESPLRYKSPKNV